MFAVVGGSIEQQAESRKEWQKPGDGRTLKRNDVLPGGILLLGHEQAQAGTEQRIADLR